MMTRPYFCSSNYLMKMSNYKSSPIKLDDVEYKWDEIFDALYYKLVSDYSTEFAKIYSTALAAKRFNSFEQSKKTLLIKLANTYINWLFKA
jgi:deoxyribodipyrimidine photolyase-related protein